MEVEAEVGNFSPIHYNLAINEETEVRELSIKPSKKALAVETVYLCLPLFVLLPALLIIISAAFINYRQFALIGGILLFIFTSIIAVTLIYFEQRRLSDEHYIVTATNVESISRTFGSKHSAYSLKGLTSISVDQSAVAKIFDYGTISLKFMGGGVCELKHVQDPENMLIKIQQIINNTNKTTNS